MLSFRPKLWTGVSAAILLTTGASGLTACGKHEAPKSASLPAGGPDSSTPPVTAAAGEAGEAGAQTAYSNVPEASRAALHLAQLKGFILIAQKQPDGPEAGGVLLGQGLLESFDKTPDLYRNAGVDEALLRKAAKTGAAADLKAAEANVDKALAHAGGEPLAVVKGLVEIAAGLYQGAVQGGSIDPIDYQHSLGAALAAQQQLARLNDPKARSAAADVKAFVALWPTAKAPEDAGKVTPAGQVLAQASRIELELN